MSRGPGKIQRRIAEVLRATPGGVFTIEDLAYECYDLADTPGGATVEKKHRVAVLRALYAMLPFDDWRFGNLKRIDNALYLVNYADARSRARLSMRLRHVRTYGGIDPDAVGPEDGYLLPDVLLRAIKATNEYLAQDGRGPSYLGPLLQEERRQHQEWMERRASLPDDGIMAAADKKWQEQQDATEREITELSWPPVTDPMMGHNGGPSLEAVACPVAEMVGGKSSDRREDTTTVGNQLPIDNTDTKRRAKDGNVHEKTTAW